MWPHNVGQSWLWRVLGVGSMESDVNNLCVLRRKDSQVFKTPSLLWTPLTGMLMLILKLSGFWRATEDTRWRFGTIPNSHFPNAEPGLNLIWKLHFWLHTKSTLELDCPSGFRKNTCLGNIAYSKGTIFMAKCTLWIYNYRIPKNQTLILGVIQDRYENSTQCLILCFEIMHYPFLSG